MTKRLNFQSIGLAALLLGHPIGSGAIAQTPLERGTALMQGIVACGNCHTPQTPTGPDNTNELAGGPPIVEPGAFKAFAPNITPDKETGIGGWSDAEIITAVREGRRPDGSIIGPPMPFHFYRTVSDADMAAIVAYLRSVPAVRRKSPKSEYSFPLPPAYGPPVTSVASVQRDTSVAYGAYLAGPLGHCVECHSTPNEKGMPDIENQLGAGGMAFHGPWGTSVSPNITPTGLGDWTDTQIKQAITKGVRPDGSRLKPPMGIAYYATLSADELSAIVAYLRSLPPK